MMLRSENNRDTPDNAGIKRGRARKKPSVLLKNNDVKHNEESSTLLLHQKKNHKRFKIDNLQQNPVASNTVRDVVRLSGDNKVNVIEQCMTRFHADNARHVMLTFSPPINDFQVMDNNLYSKFKQVLIDAVSDVATLMFGREGDVAYTEKRFAMAQGHAAQCQVCRGSITKADSSENYKYLRCGCFIYTLCLTDNTPSVVSCKCGFNYSVNQLLDNNADHDIDEKDGNDDWGNPHFGKLRHCHVLISRKRNPASGKVTAIRKDGLWASVTKAVLKLSNNIPNGIDTRPVVNNTGMAYVAKGGSVEFVNFTDEERESVNEKIYAGNVQRSESNQRMQRLEDLSEELNMDCTTIGANITNVNKDDMYQWFRALMRTLGLNVVNAVRYVQTQPVRTYTLVKFVRDEQKGISSWKTASLCETDELSRKSSSLKPRIRHILRENAIKGKAKITTAVTDRFDRLWEAFYREAVNKRDCINLCNDTLPINTHQVQFEDGYCCEFFHNGPKVYKTAPAEWCPVMHIHSPFKEVHRWTSDRFRFTRSVFGYQLLDMDFVEVFITQVLLPPSSYKQSINLCGKGGDGKTLLAHEYMNILGVKAALVKANDSNGVGFGALIMDKTNLVVDEANFTDSVMRERIKALGDVVNGGTINYAGNGQVEVPPMLAYATSNPSQMLPGLYLGTSTAIADRAKCRERLDRSITRRYLPVWFRGVSASPYGREFVLAPWDEEIVQGVRGEIGCVITHMIQRFVALGMDRYKGIAMKLRGSRLLYHDRWFDGTVGQVSYVINNPKTQMVYSNYVEVETADKLSDFAIDTLALVGGNEYHYNYDGTWRAETNNNPAFLLTSGVLETLGYKTDDTTHTIVDNYVSSIE